MIYRDFLDNVRDNILKYMPSDYMGGTVKVAKVTKDNDMVLDGLCIYKADGKSSPTVYLEQYYAKLIDGADLEYIMRKIAADFVSATEYYAHLQAFDPTDWGFVRSKVGYYLINCEKNKERLRDKVYKTIGELAKVYIVIADMGNMGVNFMLISDDLFEEWDISLEELDRAAEKNMEGHFPPVLLNMEEQMKELLTGKPAPNLLKRDIEHGVGMMYVLTNRQKIHGASVVIYPGLLEKVSLLFDDDFFIIPSSTEEVIIVPKSIGVRGFELEKSLRDVNGQIAENEILSDYLYEYIRGSNGMSRVMPG